MNISSSKDPFLKETKPFKSYPPEREHLNREKQKSNLKSVEPTNPSQTAGKDPGEKQVIEAIEKANKALRGTQTNLKFSIHEKTKQIMVKVMNSETNEVIRELPPEKVLDMVAKMWEITGLFVDEKR